MLDDHAYEHITKLIVEGYRGGQLYHSIADDDEGDESQYRGWWDAKFLPQPTDEPPPIWRCTWCGKDTLQKPCIHCDSEAVVDRTKPHHPEWSRHTAIEVECKVCDRRGPYSIQHSTEMCPGNPPQ